MQFHGFVSEFAGNFQRNFIVRRQNADKSAFNRTGFRVRIRFLRCRSSAEMMTLESAVIRSILRLLAYVALAMAIIAAVLDAARSVGASHLVTTSLQESWQSLATGSLSLVETYFKAHLYPLLWDPLMLWVLATPTFVVFAILAFLLYALGYRRENRAGRFAAR
jgi:hypothetical protein